MSKIINSFPGYEMVFGKDKKWHNMYRGTDVGFGGYVYAEPGMYSNVALLDVGNMHGASIIALNKFGDHTKKFQEIREARMAIKAREYDKVKNMLDGALVPYLKTDEDADNLANALKLILNSAFGIAAAKFDNPLRDPRDKNNIIALRGALFMRTLQDEVVNRGFQVIHIKTDSIKIPNATDDIINFCIEFGRKYGYEFEHECTYERICLVNHAVYIAKYDDKGVRNKGGKHAGEWTATGAQFQHPYVFKTLFSHKDVIFKDLCETKSVVRGVMYLDYNENLEDVSDKEKQLKKIMKENPNDTKTIQALQNDISKGHDYKFVGKVGRFTPIVDGVGAASLVVKKSPDIEKYDSVSGANGYKWFESGFVTLNHLEGEIDMSYFEKLNSEAIENIEKYGDFDVFANGTDVEYESYIEFRDSEYERMPESEDDVKQSSSDTFSTNMQEPLSA